MDYFRKATETSPAIIMTSQHHSALIKGQSTCGDTAKYKEVTSEIKKQLSLGFYSDFNIKLGIFNVKTAKSLLEILRSIKLKNSPPTINWVYDIEDEEMLEMGKDYSELIGIDFNFSCN